MATADCQAQEREFRQFLLIRGIFNQVSEHVRLHMVDSNQWNI